MWFIPAILSALTDASEKTLAKRATQLYPDEIVAFIPTLIAFVLLFPLLLFIDIPTLTLTFWMIVVIRSTLDAGARLLLIRVFRESDLSLTFPLLSLTPVFLVFVEWIATRELPSDVGGVGIVCIVVGAIVLQTYGNQAYTWRALRDHHTFQGAVFMVIIAFVYAITSLLHRLGIAQSNFLVYGVISQGVILLAVVFISLPRLRHSYSHLTRKETFEQLAPIGVLVTFGLGAQMYAQSLTLASYVIATKRSSIVFSTVFAMVFLKEKIGRRLVPILLMFIGIVLLAFQ
jgi:uncharacterized membrane protein